MSAVPDVLVQTVQTQRPSCNSAEDPFQILCKAYDLVSLSYVDAVSDADLATAAAAGVTGASLAPRTSQTTPACSAPTADFNKVCDEIDKVEDTAAAVWAAAEGLLAGLNDPYARLWKPADYLAAFAKPQERTGIGVGLGLRDGDKICRALSATCRPEVTYVVANGPAAGVLQVGDVIAEWGSSAPSGSGCGTSAAATNSDGNVFGKVQRGNSLVPFEITPATYDDPYVYGQLLAGGVGYIRVFRFDPAGTSPFDAVAGSQFEVALGDLVKGGAKRLVIDVRGNSGGSGRSLLDVLAFFHHDDETIWQAVSRRGTALQSRIKSNVTPVLNLPVAVAVDGRSASGAEVLALALRHKGAVLYGTKTLGKNTVQTVDVARAKDRTALAYITFTTSRWLSPGGSSAKDGITPSVGANLSGDCIHPVTVAALAPKPREATVTAEGPVTEGQRAVFTVSLTPAPVHDVSVTVEISDPAGIIPGRVPPQVVPIPSHGSRQISIATDDDAVDEPAGTITVTVAGPSLGYLVGSPKAASVSVADNDDPPPTPTPTTPPTPPPTTPPTPPPPPPPPPPPTTTVPAFSDLGDAPAALRAALGSLVEKRVFEGGGCGGGRLCPNDPIPRWEMAVALVRVIDGADPDQVESSRFADVDAEAWWSAHVERLAELGVTKGCATEPWRYCPLRAVNRGQMASFFVRAFDLPAAPPVGFADTSGSVHEAHIDALYAAGVTAGCRTGPLRYCPLTETTRAQMATFLARAIARRDG